MIWIAQDLRRAARLLRQSPGFGGGIVLILALGTGLNSAVLTTTHGILLRPLPYDEPSRLAVVEHRVTPSGEHERSRVTGWRNRAVPPSRGTP